MNNKKSANVILCNIYICAGLLLQFGEEICNRFTHIVGCSMDRLPPCGSDKISELEALQAQHEILSLHAAKSSSLTFNNIKS